MKKSYIAITALMCAAVCAGAVSCNGGNKPSGSKNTSVTVQTDGTETATKNDYVPVSIDGLELLYTGWIKMPTGKEYINILNSPGEKYLNGYAFPDFPAEVYKEEGEWLLIKTNNKIGYIPKTNFTTEKPDVEGHVVEHTDTEE